jgi:hypothetical protein
MLIIDIHKEMHEKEEALQVCRLLSIILPWSVAKKGNYGHNI